MSATTATPCVRETERQTPSTRLKDTQEKLNVSQTGFPFGTSLSLRRASSNRYSSKMSFQAPKPVIKKSQYVSRRRPDMKTASSGKQQALELESKLESNLQVASGGITTLMKSLVTLQKSKLVRDEQLSQYISRLGVISEELKTQLKILGSSSKLASQEDQKSFNSSYAKILALWKEYQRVSVCVVQRARVWKQASRGNNCDKDNSSGMTSMSDLSMSSEGSMNVE